LSKPRFEPLDFTEKSVEAMIDASSSFYHEVKRRRTVRDYSDHPVPEEVIRNAISAAGTGPSGANMQPWHFDYGAALIRPGNAYPYTEPNEVPE